VNLLEKFKSTTKSKSIHKLKHQLMIKTSGSNGKYNRGRSYLSTQDRKLINSPFSDENGKGWLSCGGCGNGPSEQVITLSSGSDEIRRDRRKFFGVPERRTIFLPFYEFQQLMTKKVLKQIRDAEETAIVEGTSYSVGCFLWSPVDHITKNEGASYGIQEFRHSDAIQKQQSRARQLAVTEPDEQEMRTSVLH
jgi:hypothetical protein